MSSPHHDGPLRKGWTTGACATAATKAAAIGLRTGTIPTAVTITLPKNRTPRFEIETSQLGDGTATASVRKDAGDDPDVTHQALITATVAANPAGTGTTFHAGPGVGQITQPGLPLPVGEPAINPAPRQQIHQAITEVITAHGGTADLAVTISVPGGEELAHRTWNPRLGILGGISILGTTGVVIPYSCSAWIDSIRRGIDVARALGIEHVVGATGNTSERTAQQFFGLPDQAYLDMGDFIGAMLKYLRKHPVPRVTIAGGFGKMTKLADGHLDVHSGRSQVSTDNIADRAAALGAPDAVVAQMRSANTALHTLNIATEHGIPLADAIAGAARDVACQVVADCPIAVDVLVINRSGDIVGTAGLGAS